MTDVEINKAATIERCIARAREEYDPATFRTDFTRQDALVLNLLRACEAAIDLAMHRVRVGKLGVPQDARDAFELLVRAGKLDRERADTLKKMVGFRNIAVHDNSELNLGIVAAIVQRHLDEILTFASVKG